MRRRTEAGMEKTGKVSQQRPDKAKEHGDFDARLQDAIRSHLKEWRVGVARTRDELRHSLRPPPGSGSVSDPIACDSDDCD